MSGSDADKTREAPAAGSGGNAIEQVLSGHPSGRGKTGMTEVSGEDADPTLDRDAEAEWEIDPEDTSLAAGSPTDVTDGAAGGDAGTQTSGTGSGGSGQKGQSVSGQKG
ncbi:MAG: hypothetical protein LC772_10455 [Chloroflexi bacterium]|nr:hypothetical protein [Chloroflexota bacterium]